MSETTTTKGGIKNTLSFENLIGWLVWTGIILICFAAIISKNYFTFWGLLSAIGFASGLSGILLGFLFGIPKLNKNFNNQEDNKSKGKYDPNTNLEEISDWLTKIIVGVSLTQLTKIPSALTSIADYALANKPCEFNCDFGKPIIVSIIIYFLVAGFFVGYYYARILLPKLFTLADTLETLKNSNAIWQESYKKVTSSDTTASISPDGKPVTNIKIQALTDDEIDVIKQIINSGNLFIIDKILPPNEFSAINVLLEKGIIKVIKGDTSLRNGTTLSIVDDDIKTAYTTPNG